MTLKTYPSWFSARSLFKRPAPVPKLDIFVPATPKQTGAYFTPTSVARSLTQWALRCPTDRLLDPACGIGVFLECHPNCVGLEQDPRSAAEARRGVRNADIRDTEFFSWAAHTAERFDCAAGNVPFIRYQNFKGAIRQTAQAYCAEQGAIFSGLSSSWAPFLVATASLLKPGGRMAFVVPAEIGHAPYAAPLLEYLVGRFQTVQIVALRDKLFPNLAEDCWLLYADGYGGQTTEILFSALDRFEAALAPPRPDVAIPVTHWRDLWNRRLRPFLLSAAARELYQGLREQPNSCRFGEIASVGIGYVTGANNFFHLRPSVAAKFEIPAAFLLPSVRNSRVLPDHRLTMAMVEQWRRQDDAFLLLRLPKDGELPAGVRRYLATAEAELARQAYKCRVRDPWVRGSRRPRASVLPDVHVGAPVSTGQKRSRSQLHKFSPWRACRRSSGCRPAPGGPAIPVLPGEL